jgi:hypothetical protein
MIHPQSALGQTLASIGNERQSRRYGTPKKGVAGNEKKGECPAVFGATYYLSPSGQDSANGTSPGTPWKSFAKAFSFMSSADTLILLDGTYSDAVGTVPSAPAGLSAE